MSNVIRTTSLQLAAGAVMMLFVGMAQAQYVWLDADGKKQMSDRAPPASVPLKNILKSPRPMSPQASDTTAQPAVAAVAKSAPTLADREADYRKRKEIAAKAETEAATKASDQQACANAREYQSRLSTGRRLRAQNKDGQYVVVDDAERARENETNAKVLAQCQ
ncbi:MAG: DUF4124 domain-containing protein [Pseudomonadota bacterium]